MFDWHPIEPRVGRPNWIQQILGRSATNLRDVSEKLGNLHYTTDAQAVYRAEFRFGNPEWAIVPAEHVWHSISCVCMACMDADAYFCGPYTSTREKVLRQTKLFSAGVDAKL